MNFQPLGSTVLPTQGSETIIAKQSTVADISQATRLVIAQLSPEASKELLQSYTLPTSTMQGKVFDDIALRETAIENAQQEVDLDQQWFRSADQTKPSLHNEDEWNKNNSPTP